MVVLDHLDMLILLISGLSLRPVGSASVRRTVVESPIAPMSSPLLSDASILPRMPPRHSSSPCAQFAVGRLDDRRLLSERQEGVAVAIFLSVDRKLG